MTNEIDRWMMIHGCGIYISHHYLQTSIFIICSILIYYSECRLIYYCSCFIIIKGTTQPPRQSWRNPSNWKFSQKFWNLAFARLLVLQKMNFRVSLISCQTSGIWIKELAQGRVCKKIKRCQHLKQKPGGARDKSLGYLF